MLIFFAVLSQVLFASTPEEKVCKAYVKEQLNSIPGWCSPRKAEAMMDVIFKTKPQVCVELGVFGGASLFPTACALKLVGSGVVYGIDAWDPGVSANYFTMGSDEWVWWTRQDLGGRYIQCDRLMERNKLKRFCVLIKKTFESALSSIPAIDILHIDATHTPEGDFIDAVPYIQKVKKMGHIWFVGGERSSQTYEYLKQRCQVKKVIDGGDCILLQKVVDDLDG